ncbi:uncharacterized protein LOC143017118 [Genypterus blacodes]|uniref:uncharacterized protein LOC143017118 n=1 Tax=Genypterus blacodes TaxID=154954 RepID=UPI003F77561B
METDKTTFPLLLLTALLHLLHAEPEVCPRLRHDSLSCVNDFNQNITCVWNSTRMSMNADATCTIYTSRSKHSTTASGLKYKYNASCDLEPFDVSTPGLKKCLLVFPHNHNFKFSDKLTLNLSCKPQRKNLIQISYMPSCNIKLNPPGIPTINFTTVSWSSLVPKPSRLKCCSFHLQLKQQNQAWQDASPTRRGKCDSDWQTELRPDLLVQDERYEARVRVLASDLAAGSTWSDWSPTASWVTPIGTAKAALPAAPAAVKLDVVGKITGGALALIMVIVFSWMNKNTWFCVVKKIRGPPVPNPANSFLQNFQGWLSPQFTSESYQTFLKPVVIAPVEITSTVDAIYCGSEAPLLEKIKCEIGYEGTSSSFSNPSYSHLCPPSVSSLTAGTLEPCPADSPYGPVVGQGEGANTRHDREEDGVKDMEVQLLFSKASEAGQFLQVSSDYERVEKLQVQRSRIQSPDSGMCSGEEFSQESLDEADSTGMMDGHGDCSEGKEREGSNNKEAAFQTLLISIGSVGFVSKGSIQVCSGYESVENVQAESPELQSPDSGVGSGAEEQQSQESLEDVDRSTESSSFPFPPPCGTFARLMASFNPTPSVFSGEELSSALEKIPQTINPRPVEPSGDGYMPV